MRHFVRIVFVISLFALASCALTINPVALNYSVPEKIDPAFDAMPEKAITMGKISDKRGPDDPKIIAHKFNLNGERTKGGWIAERPISDIVEDALNEALKRSNFNIDDKAATYDLYGKLISNGWRSIAFSGYKSWIEADMYLREKSSGYIV